MARSSSGALRDLLRETRLDGEGDELLLGAVVEVALYFAPLLILRGDESLAGRGAREPRSELGGQADVPEHESRLGRELGEQLSSAGVSGIVRRNLHAITPRSSPWCRTGWRSSRRQSRLADRRRKAHRLPPPAHGR